MPTIQHEFTLDEVLQGKATRIKNKDYFKTADYLEPFIERMSKFTDNFSIKVKTPDQITLTEDGNIVTDDLTFNRVNIEAILPHEYAFEGHTQVIGMVYGLDVRKPICKLYSGAERSACTNLCVFSPNGLVIQEIEPETAINYNPIQRLMERTETIGRTLRRLNDKYLVFAEKLIDEGIKKGVEILVSYNVIVVDFNIFKEKYCEKYFDFKLIYNNAIKEKNYDCSE